MSDIFVKLLCHNIEAFPQPKPDKNEGGDCFACAFLAALRFLYPEKSFTFEEIEQVFWVTHQADHINKGVPYTCLNNTWGTYPHVFKQAVERFGLDGFSHRFHFEGPPLNIEREFYAWNRCCSQYKNYWDALQKIIASGGVCYTSINLDGVGPWSNGRWTDPDHMVLFDGVRERRETYANGGGMHHREIHIVCSARGNSWKSVHDLLDLYGAGAWHVLERLHE